MNNPPPLDEIEALLAKATPTLSEGKASPKALAEMLRRGAGSQRPRARDLTNGVFNPDADAELFLTAINALPSLISTIRQLQTREAEPIPMLLWCPKCNEQHIDAPSEGWDNPPHRSHLCHACGCIWRPADVATTGVADVKTAGEADTWGWTGGDSLLPSLGKRLQAAEAREAKMREALEPFAAQHTIDEIMTGAAPDDWADATTERRIEMMGERKRKNDSDILRARAALHADKEIG